jgi:hypothetical protein
MKLEEQVLEALKTTEEGLRKKYVDPLTSKVETLEDIMQKNQSVIDAFIVSNKRGQGSGGGKIITFKDAFSQAINGDFSSKAAEFGSFQTDKDAKLTIDLKQVGDMSVSGNLTGDPMSTYNQRQGLVPSQKINFRDLIPTAPSSTGQYVTYRETGGEGSVGQQTEGSAKSQLDYDFTEVKTVTGYTAGYVRFSKQMMRNLSWLQNTLPRLLLRDFFKKENALFYAAVAAGATGYNTTAETDDAKAIIDVLMGRADADFNNSFILAKHSQVGRLLKLLYQNGYYMGSGSVVGSPDGTVRIANTPVIGASWATADKIMVIDNDLIERVETESVRVEFSYDDADNFTKNKVTARIECFEELNALRWDAHSYLDMGNES